MGFLNKLSFINNKKVIFIFFLFFFSIFFNQYYGHIGIFPVDSFTIFNSGYDVLNGRYPFKDYWTTTGFFLDIIQSFFFKIFGVSWSSYVLHASFFNAIIAISTFYTLYKFKLEINYCFLYGMFVAILAYPSVGTPFVDHHSTILSIVGLFAFILAIQTKLNFYWFILPIILGLAFLSKQVPAAYFSIIIIFLSIIYFFFNFNINKIILLILGTLTFLIFLFIFLLIFKISPLSFIEQYIFHPMSLGKGRLEFIFPFEFKRVFLRFKLIHLSMIIIFFISLKKI